MRKEALIATALLLASTTFATPLNFIITGTADFTSSGFTQGQSYSFTFTVNDEYTGGGGDFFVSNENIWGQTSANTIDIFSDIFGDSLSGAYSPVFPSGTEAQYDIGIVEEDGKQELWLDADTDSSSNIGLLSPNGTPLSNIAVEIILEGFSIPYSTSFVNPVTPWTDYLGTYTITDSASWFRLAGVYFTPTSLTIQPATTTVDAEIEIYQSIELVFPTETTSSYQVQTSSNLVDWVDFEAPFIGDGTTNSLYFSTRNDMTEFYRVKESTPPAIP